MSIKEANFAIIMFFVGMIFMGFAARIGFQSGLLNFMPTCQPCTAAHFTCELKKVEGYE